MGLSKEEDQKRKIVELALQAAKKRLSTQTGYVHLFTEDPDEVKQDTIPLLENFTYAYTLFRSKLVENIQEGKALIHKLLKFEVEGNFPYYLHEFPVCKDGELSSQLLPIFFYLIKDFSFALGEVLTAELNSLTKRIVHYLQTKETLSKGAQNRLHAFLGMWEPDNFIPETPSAWAEWCICAQMTGHSIEKATVVFSPKHFVFTGKTKDRLQEGLEPTVTLLDLFMGEYYQDFSARSLLCHPIHLRASLVHPFITQEKKIDETPFIVLVEEEKRQCFTLYFGDRIKTESLTVEAKKGTWEIKEQGPKSFELLYTPEETLPTEDESVECSLYISAHEDVSINVNGSKATAFHENDTLSIETSFGKIGVCFAAENGTWIGHISKANRSFQKKVEGYTAYDWKIGWRTLRRSSQAQVKIHIDVF